MTLFGHLNAVNSVDFSPNSEELISGSYDKTAILWDVETASLLRTIRTDDWILSVAFSVPLGDRVMTSSNASAAVWRAEDGTLIHNLYGNYSWVWDVDFAPDGLSMLTASTTVKIWDFTNGLERFNLSSHRGEVYSATYSPDGKYILTSSIDETVKLWSANLRLETFRLNRHHSPYLDAKYSPDGKLLVLANSLGYADVYNAQTDELVKSFAGTRTVAINSVSFNPQDGQQIVTGDNVGTVFVWTLENNTPVLTIPAHTARVNSVVFSPDGNMILTAGNDKTARLWDSKTGSLLHEFQHDNWVKDARFSDDGDWIVTASADKTAKVWDARTYAELLVLKGHTDFVDVALFSHDGSRIYTASDDNTIVVWDAVTGTALQTLFGHTGHVVDLDLSPDGMLLVSGSADTTVKVWDLASSKELYTFMGNNETSRSVSFSADGRRVLTASDDNTSKEFIIAYDELLQVAQEYELRPLTPDDCQRFLNRLSCDLRLFDLAASN